MATQVQSVDPFDQFVLLAVTELATADETPAHSYHVTQAAKHHLDDIERQPFGGVERQEVITALGRLADAGLLAHEQTESATGKGRPAYELADDPADVLDALADADEFQPYVDKIRSDASA